MTQQRTVLFRRFYPTGLIRELQNPRMKPFMRRSSTFEVRSFPTTDRMNSLAGLGFARNASLVHGIY